jgi:hypothetical protein
MDTVAVKTSLVRIGHSLAVPVPSVIGMLERQLVGGTGLADGI